MRPLNPFMLAILTTLARAKINTTNTSCSNKNQIDYLTTNPINATGTTSFTWNTTSSSTPWHLSLLVSNTLNPSNPNGLTTGYPYLSVPSDTVGNTCVYSLDSLNASTTGDSCAGVLEEKCVSYLRETLAERAEGLLGPRATCELAELTTEAQQARKNACGDFDLGSLAVRGMYMTSSSSDRGSS